jgi:putative MATE family efflux protein
MAKGKSIDMLQGSIWDKMTLFAIPLAFTGMLQQLYNTADVVVLGRFVSSEAMSAVGNNVPIIGLIVSICMGLALGSNVIVARYLGMRNDAKAHLAVSTSLVTAAVFGVSVLILGELFTGPLLDIMGVPESVIGYSEIYLRVYLLGLPFMAVYNFLAAIFRSKGDTATPLWALFAASVLNIFGNLAFVLVFPWGIAGVAAATVLANLVSALILFWHLSKLTGPLHPTWNDMWKVDRESLRHIVRIGWPAALQGSVFSLSNLIIQSAINGLGPEAMAGSVAGFTIESNVYCFINAFGLAATTFVSQNYGAGNLARCRRVTWVSMGINFIATACIAALTLYFGRDLLSFFSDRPEVIAIGMLRIWWVVAPEIISVVMETVSDAMRGYGYSLPPAIMTMCCVCGIRIVWVYTIFRVDSTFTTLMMVYPLSWFVTTLGLCWLYWRLMKKIERNEFIPG